MGTMEILLFIFLFAHFQTLTEAQSKFEKLDAVFSQEFFGTPLRFPLKQHFDLLSQDTVYSPDPGFYLLNEVPPFMRIPKVQVFCDQSKLSLLVDRRFSGAVLDVSQIELGNGCYSNGKLPHQLVFIYSFDECGTKHLQQNGLDVVSNILHFHPKKIHFTWWTPPAIQVTCMLKRSGTKLYFPKPTTALVHDRNFDIKAMDSSWTNTAMSNVYERSRLINLQVSAYTMPGEQLFIQSCSVLMSPDPRSKPRPAVIFNKGCTSHLHTPHAPVQFVDSHRPDVVNFVVNTSYLHSGVYIHCSLLITDQGVTFGSKSCNYNFKNSRWEELGGNIQVCQCCNSVCRTFSPKRLPYNSKTIVTTGPFIIEDKHADPESETQMSHSIPQSYSTQLDTNSALADMDQTPSLPGHTQDEQLPENDPMEQPSSTQYKYLINENIGSGEKSLNSGHFTRAVDVPALFNGWAIRPEKAAFRRKFLEKRVLQNGKRTRKDTSQEVAFRQFNPKKSLEQKRSDEVEIRQQETKEVQPLIRSKLQLSKGLDGSQMLTFEEEVIQSGFGMSEAHKCNKCFSNLLDLLRSMDKAE